ncbi:MAG TPA: hypothetical protein VG013_36510 [Gemmataceae bacterium]|jgi:hypothetical protein|nr:hypothetical protein [Gemmataceae bacterium]
MDWNLDTASLKEFLFFFLHLLLERSDGPQHARIEVRATNPAGFEVCYVLRPEDWPHCAAAVHARLDDHPSDALLAALVRTFFSQEERVVVEILRDRVLTGQAIAARSSLTCGTSFKLLLSNLVGRGVLSSGPDGYQIAEPLVLEVLDRPHRQHNNLLARPLGS